MKVKETGKIETTQIPDQIVLDNKSCKVLGWGNKKATTLSQFCFVKNFCSKSIQTLCNIFFKLVLSYPDSGLDSRLDF